MRNAGLAWFTMILCLAYFFWPHGAEPAIFHIRRLISGYVGAPVSLLLCISFLRDGMLNKPVLVVDDSGIAIRDEPLIPWAEIESVRAFTRNGKEYIGVYARDIDRLAAAYPEATAQRLKSVNERMGAVVVLAQETLPKSIDEVMTEIGDFCRSKTSV